MFLAALSRFISRRGRCTDLFSDCGLNFVGAKNYLQEVQSLVTSPEFEVGIVKNHIRWHLNPPAATAYGRTLGSRGKIGQNSPSPHNSNADFNIRGTKHYISSN